MSELKKYLVTYNVIKKVTMCQNRVYTARTTEDAIAQFEYKGVKATLDLLAEKGQDAEFEFDNIEVTEISVL